MGFYLGNAVEIAGVAGLILVQWQITRLANYQIKRHLSGSLAHSLQLLVSFALALAALGLTLNLPHASTLPLDPRFFGWMRGAGLFWALTSTPIWLGGRLVYEFGIAVQNDANL